MSEGCEECGSGADHDVRLAAPHKVPLVETLSGGEPRMKHGNLVAEARAKAADRLWRERYLGHQHTRVATAREHSLDSSQVHLRLARSRNAVQNDHASHPGVH